MYLHVLVCVGSGHTGPSLQIRVGIKGSEMRSGVAVLEQVSLTFATQLQLLADMKNRKNSFATFLLKALQHHDQMCIYMSRKARTQNKMIPRRCLKWHLSLVKSQDVQAAIAQRKPPLSECPELAAFTSTRKQKRLFCEPLYLLHPIAFCLFNNT